MRNTNISYIWCTGLLQGVLTVILSCIDYGLLWILQISYSLAKKIISYLFSFINSVCFVNVFRILVTFMMQTCNNYWVTYNWRKKLNVLILEVVWKMYFQNMVENGVFILNPHNELMEDTPIFKPNGRRTWNQKNKLPNFCIMLSGSSVGNSWQTFSKSY